MTVKELMKTDIAACAPGDTLTDVAKTMRDPWLRIRSSRERGGCRCGRGDRSRSLGWRLEVRLALRKESP